MVLASSDENDNGLIIGPLTGILLAKALFDQHKKQNHYTQYSHVVI